PSRRSCVQCTAPGSLDNGLAYAACLKVCSCQAVRMSAGLRWPFFSISHSALWRATETLIGPHRVVRDEC
ncbi:MAG TPA: hypothetical protein VEY69_17035, partial [Lautropia sp.]|nr:hypothetical protein [Lautropia sp.]